MGVHSTGKIQYFEDNNLFTYALADASDAYQGGVTDKMWIKKMAEAGVEASRKNGFGNAGVTKFKRHLLFIKPHTLIIYDELEAEKPISWTWLLHSPHEMKLSSDYLFTSNQKFQSRMKLLSSIDCEQMIDTKFHEPAVNWVKKKLNGKLVEYKDQWHFKAKTEKSSRVKFLSVIQLSPKDNNFSPLKIQSSGKIEFDDFKLITDLSQGEAKIELKQGDKTLFLHELGSSKIKKNNASNFTSLTEYADQPSR